MRNFLDNGILENHIIHNVITKPNFNLVAKPELNNLEQAQKSFSIPVCPSTVPRGRWLRSSPLTTTTAPRATGPPSPSGWTPTPRTSSGPPSRSNTTRVRPSRRLQEVTVLIIITILSDRGRQRRRYGGGELAAVVRPRATEGVPRPHRDQGLRVALHVGHVDPDRDHRRLERQQDAARVKGNLCLQLHGEYFRTVADRTRREPSNFAR